MMNEIFYSKKFEKMPNAIVTSRFLNNGNNFQQTRVSYINIVIIILLIMNTRHDECTVI